MVQASIFDQAEQAKQHGMELVYRHADTLWKKEAVKELQLVCHRERYFTSEDILVALERRGITTGDNRALGMILQSASRAGMITATDVFVRARRKKRHGAPIMRWQSNMRLKSELDTGR